MGFGERIAPYVRGEWAQAEVSERAGQPARAFEHLEAAHVLGQRSTRLHVLAHVRMLAWALRHGAWSEAWGQVLRIVGAATKTALGLLPEGNTGGTSVSPFRPLPLRPDHARVLAWARAPGEPSPPPGD